MYSGNYALTAVSMAVMAITGPSKSLVCVTTRLKAFGRVMTGGASNGGVVVIE